MKHSNKNIALVVAAVFVIILIFLILRRIPEGNMTSDSTTTQSSAQVFTAEEVSDRTQKSDTVTDGSANESSPTVETVTVTEEYEIELGETESIDGF